MLTKAKIQKIYFTSNKNKESKKLWFVDCVSSKKFFEKAFLICFTYIPKVGDYVLVNTNTLMRYERFAITIYDYKQLMQEGEAIVGQFKDNNYLKFSNNDIKTGSNTNNLEITTKSKVKLTGNSNVDILDNVSLERSQDNIRITQILAVFNALSNHPSLVSIKAIIDASISLIQASQIQSTTLKGLLDSTQ